MWRKRQLCKRYLWKCYSRLWCKISYCKLISAEQLKCYSDCDTKQRTNKNFEGRTKTENFNLDRLQTDQSINILFQGLATKHNMLFYGWMRFYPVTKVDFQIMKPKAKNRVWMNIAKSLCVKIYFKRTWNHIHRVIFSMMRWIPIVFASHWVLQLLGFGLLSQFDSQEKRPKIIFCTVFYGKNLTLKPEKVWWEFSAYLLSYFLYCTFAFGETVVGANAK